MVRGWLVCVPSRARPPARPPAPLAVERQVGVLVRQVGKDGLVFVRAQRDIQRIIDAAATEALGSLGIDAHGIRHVVLDQYAGRHALRVGLVDPPTVAIGKQAAAGDGALFFVVVIAGARGHTELVIDVVGGLAEHGVLCEVVRQVGVER